MKAISGIYHSIPYFNKTEEISKVTQLLRHLPRMPPHEALAHPTIKKARKLDRSISCCQKKCHAAFYKQYDAARLGVDTEILDKNPNFHTFAKKNRLWNYMATYQDTLSPDLVIHGKKWEDVREIAMKPCKGFAWKYGPNGIQDSDMFDWDDPPIFKKYTREEAIKLWGGGYAIQICTTCIPERPRPEGGDHTYYRICDPEGNVYSFGLYRPAKRSCWENFWFPCKVKMGSVTSPDPSEFWNVPIQTLTVAVSEEDAKKQLEALKKMKKNGLPFQMLVKNCTEWALNMTGIHLNAKCNAFRAITPQVIQDIVDAVRPSLNAFAYRISEVALAILLNSVQVLLGGWYVDPEVKKNNPTIKPNLNSVDDFLNIEKLMLNSPHKLGCEVFPKIEKWRREQPDPEKVRFALPPKYWNQKI